MREKRVLVISLVILFALACLPIALAASGDPFSSIKDVIYRVFQLLLDVFKLGWLRGSSDLVAFMRFVIWVLTFALFNAITQLVFARTLLQTSGGKRLPVVISICLATITAVFMPASVLLMIGMTYSTVWAVILMGILFGAMLWICYKQIKGGDPINHLFRLLILWLCWMLIFNLMALLEQNPSGESYNTIINPVFESMWGFLDGIIGILIIIEIIQIFKNIRTGTPGGGTPASQQPGGTNPPPASGGVSNRGGGGTSPQQPTDENRPPGRQPPPTPPQRNPSDPPMPHGAPPPGIVSPIGPEPHVPSVPKKPKIPDEEQIYIDLSPRFNGVRSQDSIGACTAFAAASIFEYILHVRYNHQKNYLSPLYLYYRTREAMNAVDSDTGAPSSLALDTLIKEGVCFEYLWGFEPKTTNKWRVQPNADATNDAVQKRILSFSSVPRNDPDQWVHQLQEGNPLYIGVHFPGNLCLPYKKAFYYDYDGSNVGGHAMVIVGYHSHYPYNGAGVKAFKLRNSHDVGWGENGYTWIPAATLMKMLINDPYAILGWNNKPAERPHHKYKITGRAVYDDKEGSRIPASLTGKDIYDLKDLDKFDHGFYVGAVAQIGEGQLYVLGQTQVKNKDGRFKLEFEADPSTFMPLTKLAGIHSLSDIPFGKLPAGVVVLKSTNKIGKNLGDGDIYFHIAAFSHSQAGRGGEGATHPDNPNSAAVHKGLNFSGIPILFDSKHTEEHYVIIPIYPSALGPKPNNEKEASDEEKVLADAKKFVQAQKEILDNELKFLSALRNELTPEKAKTGSFELKNTKTILTRLDQLKANTVIYTRQMDNRFYGLEQKFAKEGRKDLAELHKNLRKVGLVIIEYAGKGTRKKFTDTIIQLDELSRSYRKEQNPKHLAQIGDYSAQAQSFVDDEIRQLESIYAYLSRLPGGGNESPAQNKSFELRKNINPRGEIMRGKASR